MTHVKYNMFSYFYMDVSRVHVLINKQLQKKNQYTQITLKKLTPQRRESVLVFAIMSF
ncbi:hypothetical protein Hdeb2414_s0009g00302391 [Helianthus debilis subsp. tardiflorus]